MVIASYVNIKPELAHSRTYEDFYKFLGQVLAPFISDNNCKLDEFKGSLVVDNFEPSINLNG